jgi:chromosome segregation ATPase
LVKGDSATVQAEKVFRQAQSALNVQINSLKGDTINFEDAITEAQEELAKAKVNNGLAITDRGSYVQVLLNKKNKLTTAEENLEGHKAKLSFLEETLKSLEAEESPVEQAA